jgi:hypothetical protein
MVRFDVVVSGRFGMVGKVATSMDCGLSCSNQLWIGS